MRNIALTAFITSSMIFRTRAFTALSASKQRWSAVTTPLSQHQRLPFPNIRRLHVPVLAASSSSSSNLKHDADTTPASVKTNQKAVKRSKTQLRNDLKQYRTQQAAQKPAYTIFTNAALDEIYATLPTTPEQLLSVKGIGPKKLEMFGTDILSIVSQYTDGEQEPAQPIPRPTLIDPKSLTPEQRRVADFLLSPSRPNVFCTGSAGTGKSHVLSFFVQELRRTPTLKVGVCAPTGVAAIHVGGSTLHSFFGIGLGTGSLSSLVNKVKKNKDAQKRIDETDVLIIDECSMLSSDLLETLDAVVRKVRKDGACSEEPFGGMQVVLFGDFFQLPPVSRGYEKPFGFDSPVWSELGLTENMVELVEVQRQANGEFVDLLNKVRIGQMSEREIQDLNARCVISEDHALPTDGIVPTRLYVLNRDVDAVNDSRLAELEGKEVVCQARNNWRENMPLGTPASVKKRMTENLSKQMPDEVRLKVGAQVMLTRNKDLEKNLVNGSRGVIVRFDKSKDGETAIPVVRFDCGIVTSIAPAESVGYNPDGGAGCLVRLQVPLKLAWAITVHKSQGTTLTRALLDISSAFEYGQCYVALSRVKSLEGLWLEKPARLGDIKVSPQVLDFYVSSSSAMR